MWNNKTFHSQKFEIIYETAEKSSQQQFGKQFEHNMVMGVIITFERHSQSISPSPSS
jgi:hypothetical protein